MKVVHVNDKLDVAGGVEVYIRDLMALQVLRGIDVEWIALRSRGAIIEVVSNTPELNWRGPLSCLCRSPLLAAVDRHTIFHVHSLSEPAILQSLFELAPVIRHMHEPRMFCPGQGKFWAKTETVCSIPYGLHCLVHAYTQHCCNRHPKRLSKQFLNTAFEIKTASRSYASIIANSDYTKSEAIKVGYEDGKLSVIPYFTPLTSEPDWEMAVPPVVCFAGRLSRTKGVHILLDAFRLVVDVIPNAKLEILGAGHDQNIFWEQSKNLNLNKNVKFHGWADRETLNNSINGAAVVAFPSIYPEAFGITGIEAMMRGKPVVAFDVGGVSDWLHNEDTGLFATRIDAVALSDSLKRLIQNPELSQKMGQKARKTAQRDFNPEKHIASISEIYERAL